MNANSSEITSSWLRSHANICDQREGPAGGYCHTRILKYLREENFITIKAWENMPKDQGRTDLNDTTRLKRKEYAAIRAAAESALTPPSEQKPSRWFSSLGRVWDKIVGETKPKTRQSIGLVLLGETGVGKSTFFQALVDYCEKKRVDNVGATERNLEVKEGESQTKETYTKDVLGPDYVLHIIDTPGVGDTEGKEADDRHMKDIAQFLEFHEFNVVCVLIKDGQNRLSDRVSYIIGQLKENLTTNIWPDHIFTILTRCPKNKPPGLDTVRVIEAHGLPGPGQEGAFFTVENCAYEKTTSAPTTVSPYIRARFNETQEQLEAIIRAAGELPVITGQEIVRLREERKNAREKGAELVVAIENIQNWEAKLQEVMDLLQGTESVEERERLLNKKITFQITKRELFGDGYRGMVCEQCHSDCHVPCTHTGRWKWWCGAFSWGGTCRHCQHDSTQHYVSEYHRVSITEERNFLNDTQMMKVRQEVNEKKAWLLAKEKFQENLNDALEERNRLTLELAETYATIDTLGIGTFSEIVPDLVKGQMEESEKLAPEEKQRRQRQLQELLDLYEEKKREIKSQVSSVGFR